MKKAFVSIIATVGFVAGLAFGGTAMAGGTCDSAQTWNSNVCTVTGLPVAPGDTVVSITNHHINQAKLPTSYVDLHQQVVHPAAPAVVYVGQTDIYEANAVQIVPVYGDQVAVANLNEPVVRVVSAYTK